MKKVRITVFADPVCTWCWGSSPIIRALEYRYGEQIEFEYCMVGMIDDIATYNNRRLQIGGDDIELSNRNILAHWLEASSIHGMPVESKHFHLFNSKYRSTIPHCKAYIAAKHCCTLNADGSRNITAANKYLRRIQEATAAEAMHTSDPDVLADLSAVCGFKPKDIRKEMESECVKKEFQRSREKAGTYDINTTPSYIIEYNGNEVLINGFCSYETIENHITNISGWDIRPITADKDGKERLNATYRNVLQFVKQHSSVYPVEIATTLKLKKLNGRTALNIESFEHMPAIVEELIKDERISITPVANSFKIYYREICNSDTRKKEREVAGTF